MVPLPVPGRIDGRLHLFPHPLEPAPMADAPKPDYRSTVFLPRTDFPMKAGLPQKEPLVLARWESEGLYQRLRKSREGRSKFIFHDGPPYANGDIHIGHALNHVLKDMVVRTQTLLGKDAPYVPGWDCHGLPIEWKVEEQYRKKKLNKDEVPVREFRADGVRQRGDHRCRADEVRRDGPALPRRQAGDVVAGRKDRAGRSRDRI
jgi:hypothetical protein